MEAFLAFFEHVHSTLTTTYHNTPIMLMASPQWTRPDCEAIARYTFEKTKTPALCLLHSGVATQYGLKWPHMTVIDIGFEKVDVTCIYDSRVVNHMDLGHTVDGGSDREISGGEVFTQKLVELLTDKDFTRDMAEQLKKSPICEVLPYASDHPKRMDLPQDAESIRQSVATAAAAAAAAVAATAAAAAAAAAASAGPPQIIEPSLQSGVDEGDDEINGDDMGIDTDGVLDVASIVTSGQTKEFLAKKEKEKMERGKGGRRGKDKDLEGAKPSRLPNTKRVRNVFFYEEFVTVESTLAAEDEDKDQEMEDEEDDTEEQDEDAMDETEPGEQQQAGETSTGVAKTSSGDQIAKTEADGGSDAQKTDAGGEQVPTESGANGGETLETGDDGGEAPKSEETKPEIPQVVIEPPPAAPAEQAQAEAEAKKPSANGHASKPEQALSFFPSGETPAPSPAAGAAPGTSTAEAEHQVKKLRHDIEIGLERFEFADRREIDRIVTAIYRTVQGVEDMYMRPSCWENIVFVGNGSRLRGLKENILQTLTARHLISPSSATMFTSELPSNLATPSGTGSQTPTGNFNAPPHQLPTSSSVNPLLQAATTASLALPGGPGSIPGGIPGAPGSNAGDNGISGGHSLHFHSQTPTSIKLAQLPTYLNEWTKNGFEEAMFLGAQVVARLAFCIHNLDAQGLEGQRMMSLNRVDYK